ncbi:MAG: tetratricopeptide repeat protein [bacterium]|nr:tetratricopeptide repeat protein [bacterium]
MNEVEKFNQYLENEFNLLIRREFNVVINDLKQLEEENINDINDSIKNNKTLFTNYTELVLYTDDNDSKIGDYLKYDYVTLYGILGEAYFQRGMYDESLKALDRAIKMSPTNILLIQRKMFALKNLDLFDELEKMIFKTFKFCYTKDALINQYTFLANVFEKKKMYKEASYILYLMSVSFGEYEKFLPDLNKLETLANKRLECPEYNELMNFVKEYNIMTPYDLSTYYLSFYEELMKNEDKSGALDFLKCSNSVCYDKKNIKLIKKLTKTIEKEKKKAA